MSKTWICSDWHFGHQKEFLWEPRGFESAEEMNEAIIERHNSVAAPEDDVYVLGDLMLSDDEAGMAAVARLNGRLHLARGNHDSDRRWAAYQTLPNVVEQETAYFLKRGKYHFYLSHFPSMTGYTETEKRLSQMTLNFFGHTHQKTNFFEDKFFMYHCGMDSHDCYPVLLDDALNDIRAKRKEMEEQANETLCLSCKFKGNRCSSLLRGAKCPVYEKEITINPQAISPCLNCDDRPFCDEEDRLTCIELIRREGLYF